MGGREKETHSEEKNKRDREGEREKETQTNTFCSTLRVSVNNCEAEDGR